MSGRVVVLGGSVAGLSAAIGLARAGFEVTVIERDPGPSTVDGDEAFFSWERRSVAQFRQPHGFSARSRNLLLQRIPEVIDRLRADGIEEFNVFKAVAPPEMWRPEDDEFTGFMTRRPAFELALRLVAETEPGLTIMCPATATSLRCSRTDDGTLQAVGIAFDNGERVDGDFVLDCAGRRSPMPRWLAEHDVVVPEVVQDCEATYFTRYFRRTPDCAIPAMLILALRGVSDRLTFIGFPGDHETFGILLIASPQDEPMRILRHNWAWETAARAMTPVAPWIDPANALPLGDVETMTGHQNMRREFVVDGRPLVVNLLPAGDSLCTTNPAYGWGASMALTYAFSAVDAITQHAGDPVAVALAYDDAVRAEADAVYRESAAMDRLRIYELHDEPVPEEDAVEWERQDLLRRGLQAGAFRDPVLGRAMLRRTNLLDRPDGTLDDPEVEKRAREVRDIMASKTPKKIGPDRDELRALLAAAAPGS